MSFAKWKSVSASVMGTSHLSAGTPCQDACRVAHLNGENGSWLVATVADGAGSASHAHYGAECVADTFIRIVERSLLTEQTFDFSLLGPDGVTAWMREIREEAEKLAAELNTPLREVASTCLGAVIGESSAFFLQLGDGAIVTSCDAGYRAVFWPQSGEFANTTNFISDSQFDTKFEWCVLNERIDEVALFSDGLERLILRFAERAVHGAFLEPFFSVLRKTETPEAYLEPLQSFLNSAKVNERTDDDKSLVLATRLNEHRRDDTIH